MANGTLFAKALSILAANFPGSGIWFFFLKYLAVKMGGSSF